MARVADLVRFCEALPLNFVGIEQKEAGIVPFGVDFKNPNAQSLSFSSNKIPVVWWKMQLCRIRLR
ncbi:MAG: hypothetical protein WBZ01_16290 [Terriglobales bacterium]